MKREFWREKWKAQQIGFHRAEVNEALLSYAGRVFKPNSRILVPLCGMTLDMDWLLEQGYSIVGVEFVPEAVEGLKQRWGTPDESREEGAFRIYRWGERCTIVQGDFFQLSAAGVGLVDGVWDRASIVALNPSTRVEYQNVLSASLSSQGVVLMRTFAYDQSKMDGPPFSVEHATLKELFPVSEWTLEVLEQRRTTPEEKMKSRGLEWQSVDTYVIRR